MNNRINKNSAVILTAFVILIVFLITGCISSPEGNGLTVEFPQVGEPVQITKGDKEHLFASYYGINSFSKSQQYVTVLETDVKHHLPDENDFSAGNDCSEYFHALIFPLCRFSCLAIKG